MVRRSQRNVLKNNRGMTLIEIMIVLAILGSLMALVLPKIVGGQDKAKVKEAKIQIGQIVTSLSLYYSDCGKYPKALAGLTKADGNCTNWGPEPYYKSKDGTIRDPWGNEFLYELNGAEFVLKTLGRDGAEGGSSYDADITNEDL